MHTNWNINAGDFQAVLPPTLPASIAQLKPTVIMLSVRARLPKSVGSYSHSNSVAVLTKKTLKHCNYIPSSAGTNESPLFSFIINGKIITQAKKVK